MSKFPSNNILAVKQFRQQLHGLLLPVNHRWINQIQIYISKYPEQCEKHDQKKEKTDFSWLKNRQQIMVLIFDSIIQLADLF